MSAITTINSLKKDIDVLNTTLQDFETQLNATELKTSDLIGKISFLDKNGMTIKSLTLTISLEIEVCGEDEAAKKTDLNTYQKELQKIQKVWEKNYTLILNKSINHLEQEYKNTINSNSSLDADSKLNKLKLILRGLLQNREINSDQKSIIATLLDKVSSKIAELEAERKKERLSEEDQEPSSSNSQCNMNVSENKSLDTSVPPPNLDAISPELLPSILTQLSVKDLLSIAQVNRFLNKASNDAGLWKQVVGCTKQDYMLSNPYSNLIKGVYHLTNLNEPTSDNGLAISQDGSTLFSCHGNTLKFWDVKSGQCLHTFSIGEKREVSNISLSPDGRTLFSTSYYDTLHIWDVKSGSCISSLSGDKFKLEALVLTPDHSTLFSASSDNTIKVWDIKSGDCINTLKGHTSEVKALLLSPDGSKLFSSSFDNTINIWDVKSGKCISTLTGHQFVVDVLTLSPDGSKLFSGSFDKTIKIWDLKSGKCISTLTGHTGGVLALALSLGGSTLFSGSSDKTIKIWDVRSGECTSTLKGHLFPVKTIVLSPDGSKLFSGSFDKTIKIWNLKGPSAEIFLELAEMFSSANPLESEDALERFQRMPQEKKNKIYGQLFEIKSFPKEYFGCAEDAFLNRKGLTAPDKKRAQAIYRFLLQEIVDQFKSGTSKEALTLFNKLPGSIKDIIYGELFRVMTFAKPYWNCAEHAFLGLNNQHATDEKRIEAIESYLLQTAIKR